MTKDYIESVVRHVFKQHHVEQNLGSNTVHGVVDDIAEILSAAAAANDRRDRLQGLTKEELVELNSNQSASTTTDQTPSAPTSSGTTKPWAELTTTAAVAQTSSRSTNQTPNSAARSSPGAARTPKRLTRTPPPAPSTGGRRNKSPPTKRQSCSKPIPFSSCTRTQTSKKSCPPCTTGKWHETCGESMVTT